MGQRSQIYILIKDKDNNKTLIAKYFQWNFGERMISRTRYGIEYIKRSIEYINQKSVQERINKIFDINFDMQDVALSQDIIQETREDFWGNKQFTNDYIFLNQDNNDGKLFIECDQNFGEIKLCFTDYDINILTPNEYMKWDMGDNWSSDNFYNDIQMDKDWQEKIPVCEDNIKFINENVKLMDEVELEQFIKGDYSMQIGDSKFKMFLKDFIEKGMKKDEFMCFHIERLDENNSWKLYDKYSPNNYMEYDCFTNELKISHSFKESYYEGIVQDVCDYYGLEFEKNLIEISTNSENFNKESEKEPVKILEENETEINYEYD